MAQLLGIDLGTTNTKAIIFDELGNLLSRGCDARRPMWKGTCEPLTMPKLSGDGGVGDS